MSHQRMFRVATEPNSMFREPLLESGIGVSGRSLGSMISFPFSLLN